MGNGKITKELKGLGLKVNDKEPSGETVSEVIKGISDDYEGGSGATYTAGNGIGITDENVINADIKILEVSNITGLTTEQCESLNVGDVVVKLTSNQKHTYTVSYKEAGVGMCLTYVDASTSETVSYDYTGGQWVYNSIDITPLKNVVANPVLAGTETNLTGLQVGDTKFKVGSESHLYEYLIKLNLFFGDYDVYLSLNILTNKNKDISNVSLSNIYEIVEDLLLDKFDSHTEIGGTAFCGLNALYYDNINTLQIGMMLTSVTPELEYRGIEFNSLDDNTTLFFNDQTTITNFAIKKNILI